MTGSGLAQALVFSFMANPVSTGEEVNQAAASAGMALSTPGLDKRFNARARYFLDRLLAEAVQHLVHAVAPAESGRSRFNGVYVGDSTLVALPKALAALFRGPNRATAAAAKVAVHWELGSGGLRLWLSDGTVHDQRSGIVAHALPAGALRLNHLGFFNLERLAQAMEGRICCFSRYKVGTLAGNPLDRVGYLRRQKQQPLTLTIQLGAKRLPCRLIALAVPPAQVGKRRKQLRETARRQQQPLRQRSLD